MNSFSQKITPLQASAIKQILIDDGAAFGVVQYSFWQAKGKNYSATYYTSGKFLIQGKGTDALLSKAVSVFGAVEKEEQQSLIDTGGEKYIGTDESGKGDFFGPLVIAGVQVDENNKQKFLNAGIKDSKKLDDKKILQLSNIIKANSVHSVVVITPVKYNELYSKFKNLNKLLAWGHARAIENILEKSPCNYALADKFGDESLIQNALMKKGGKITLKQSVRAEADIAVAAASVLARAEYVKRMNDAQRIYELNFPKGASEKVKESARAFCAMYSKDRLNEVAKMHFKTASEI